MIFESFLSGLHCFDEKLHVDLEIVLKETSLSLQSKRHFPRRTSRATNE